MAIEVDIKKSLVVNGKEYASLDEVPGDVRDAIREAFSGRNMEAGAKGSIVLNGKEYARKEEMPPAERAIYEQVMGSVASGDAGRKGLGRTLATASLSAGAGSSEAGPAVTLSFSLTPVFAVLAALVAALGLYLYFR